MLTSDTGLLFSASFYSLPRAVHGDADIHTENPHIRIIFHTYNFYVFFETKSEVALNIKRLAGNLIVDNWKNLFQKVDGFLFSQSYGTRYRFSFPYAKIPNRILGFSLDR